MLLDWVLGDCFGLLMERKIRGVRSCETGRVCFFFIQIVHFLFWELMAVVDRVIVIE